MTHHQKLQQLFRDVAHIYGVPDEDDLALAKRIFDAGFTAGTEEAAKVVEESNCGYHFDFWTAARNGTRSVFAKAIRALLPKEQGET